MSLIPDYMEHEILSRVGHALKLYLVGRGIAFTIPLSGISNIINDAVLESDDRIDRSSIARAPISKKKGKQKMHELVIAVVNDKFTDVTIEAAKSAGATGATVFHTKSFNNAKAEQAIGTSFSSETDSIFLLTSTEYKARIMEAIRDVAGLKTDGGAVIFSLPVDDLVGIGRFEDFENNAEE
jgi:nitrogen regulatory protein PII